MISSHDEFRLLLNKWMSESKELFVVTWHREGISLVCGTLRDLDDETLSIKDAAGNLASVSYRHCKFVYESELPGWGTAYLTGKKFQDVFVLQTPTGTLIAIGAAIPAS